MKTAIYISVCLIEKQKQKKTKQQNCVDVAGFQPWAFGNLAKVGRAEQ